MKLIELNRLFFQLFHRKPDIKEEEKLIYMAQRRNPEEAILDVAGDDGD